MSADAIAACVISGAVAAVLIGWLLLDYAKAKRSYSRNLTPEAHMARQTMVAAGRIGAAFWYAQQAMRREAEQHVETRGHSDSWWLR